jgi:hypothetical protein
MFAFIFWRRRETVLVLEFFEVEVYILRMWEDDPLHFSFLF